MKLPSERRPSMILLVALLIAALCSMFLIKKCSHETTRRASPIYPAKSLGDTIDVAIEISPLSYSLSRDTISGLDYDIIREMATKHKRAVKFHPFTPLEYAIQGLSNGTFDIVVSSLPLTTKLKEALPMTDYVYTDREVLVQRKDSAFIGSPEKLAGDSVWIPAASPIRERLVNLSKEIGDTIHIVRSPGHTSEHLIIMVALGQIKRAVVNEGVARRLASRYPDIDITTPVSFSQFQSWAVSPKNIPLRDTINAWLRDFRATPRYEAILAEYLN